MARAPDPRRLAAEKRKQAADELRWVVEFDGAEHTFRLSDMSAVDVGALRREAQLSLGDLVGLVEQGVFDAQVALLWMARRQAGEARLAFADVAADVTLGQVVYVREESGPEPEEGAPDPPP